MKKLTDIQVRPLQVRPLLGATAGLLTMLLIAGGSPAAAQSSDAADKCTGDVMRLCSEFVPDADRIVVCLKGKRRQLSPECLGALGGGAKGGGAGAEKPRHHKRVRHHRA